MSSSSLPPTMKFAGLAENFRFSITNPVPVTHGGVGIHQIIEDIKSHVVQLRNTGQAVFENQQAIVSIPEWNERVNKVLYVVLTQDWLRNATKKEVNRACMLGVVGIDFAGAAKDKRPLKHSDAVKYTDTGRSRCGESRNITETMYVKRQRFQGSYAAQKVNQLRYLPLDWTAYVGKTSSREKKFGEIEDVVVVFVPLNKINVPEINQPPVFSAYQQPGMFSAYPLQKHPPPPKIILIQPPVLSASAFQELNQRALFCAAQLQKQHQMTLSVEKHNEMVQQLMAMSVLMARGGSAPNQVIQPPPPPPPPNNTINTNQDLEIRVDLEDEQQGLRDYDPQEEPTSSFFQEFLAGDNDENKIVVPAMLNKIPTPPEVSSHVSISPNLAPMLQADEEPKTMMLSSTPNGLNLNNVPTNLTTFKRDAPCTPRDAKPSPPPNNEEPKSTGRCKCSKCEKWVSSKEDPIVYSQQKANDVKIAEYTCADCCDKSKSNAKYTKAVVQCSKCERDVDSHYHDLGIQASAIGCCKQTEGGCGRWYHLKCANDLVQVGEYKQNCSKCPSEGEIREESKRHFEMEVVDPKEKNSGDTQHAGSSDSSLLGKRKIADISKAPEGGPHESEPDRKKSKDADTPE